ncbi:MAG: hypothetical protein PHX60_06920 [Giesbergeria sp.]|uniref:hypothetical protein n=1 Tax=Giesbergeria sp. TaxID=2818473 RepID=UPI00261272EE|nr:hypothetical protein [Giesbergeria sp.]MDD2609417.1 hypothetical protein [Giesbergeria sp.]
MNSKFEKQGHINVQVAPKKSFGEVLGAFLAILILGLPVFFIGLAIGFIQGKKKATEKSEYSEE